jgi:hypothetical protein
LTDDQQAVIVEGLLRRASEGIFIRKRELLNKIEHMYGKILTFGWVNWFLATHHNQITTGTMYPQKDLRLQVPRVFLNRHLALVKEEIDELTGRNYACLASWRQSSFCSDAKSGAPHNLDLC